ncbi:hypothetical protein UlMin_010518 [Ulmus minor]
MEDEHICIDNLVNHLGVPSNFPSTGAFYGVCKFIAKFLELLYVFDGYGGTDVALFIKENILRFIVEDVNFPFCAKKSIRTAFLNAYCDDMDATSAMIKISITLTTLLLMSVLLIVLRVHNRYLNGQLSVAKALSDWHMKGTKGSLCPLNEFLILSCDGLWDVMTSQCAVTMERKELMLHNDPKRCSRELFFKSNV